MPIVLKSGNLNLLEPSGSVQACNGIAFCFLPLLFVCSRYLPDADNVTIDAFYRLVSGLSNVNFGDFDMIGTYFGNSTEDAERLDGLNLTFLMLQVGKPCGCLCRAELGMFLIRRSHVENCLGVGHLPFS